MSIWDCLPSHILGAVFEHRYWVPAHSYILPLLHLGTYVVFSFMSAPRHYMLTLLGGAECTCVSWEHSLSYMSGLFYDYMFKEMCQACESDSQLLLSA